MELSRAMCGSGYRQMTGMVAVPYTAMGRRPTAALARLLQAAFFLSTTGCTVHNHHDIYIGFGNVRQGPDNATGRSVTPPTDGPSAAAPDDLPNRLYPLGGAVAFHLFPGRAAIP